ncbi:MAG: MFS transporter [Dehalococcoidia bacterium]
MSAHGGRPPLRAAFASLHIRNYRLYFSGQLISQVGTWMQSTALSWYVLSRTHSALALGAVSTFRTLPVLLFALFGGVIADRLPKQRLLIGTQTTLALQAIMLALLMSAGLLTIPLLYLLAAVQGFAMALDNPARQSFVMEMVGPQDVPNAVALNSSMLQMTRLVGPALGGITIALVGTALCFYLNAISFVAVLIGLLLMDPSRFYRVERPKRAAMLRQIGEGLHYAVTTPDILLAVITMAVLGTFGYNFQVFVPLIAQFVLHTSSVGFGLLTSSLAVGSLLAAFGVAWLGRGSRRSLLIGAVGFSVVLVCVGLAGSWLTLVPLLVLLGLSSTVFTATNTARLQLIAPSHLRGRMMSINTLLFMGSTPIGSLVIGGLADRAGVRPAVAAMGGLCILGVIASLLYLRRMHDRLLPAGAEFTREPERETEQLAPVTADR